MVKWRKILFLLAVSLNLGMYAQLPDGSIAPNFTLTDYYGTTHELYAYLNAEKTVFLEIFAAHCPSCWNYHQTNRLKDLYNMYGPSGTDEVMVLALEYDQYNDSNAFLGNGPAWVTQGNWLDGTPYPIFNVEGPDRDVFMDYNVTFYPVIYRICPNKVLERVMTFESVTQLYQKVQDCQALVSIAENEILENSYIDQFSKSLIIEAQQQVRSIEVMNIQGQVVKTIGKVARTRIPLGDLDTGVYLFRLQTDNGAVIKKFYLK